MIATQLSINCINSARKTNKFRIILQITSLFTPQTSPIDCLANAYFSCICNVFHIYYGIKLRNVRNLCSACVSTIEIGIQGPSLCHIIEIYSVAIFYHMVNKWNSGLRCIYHTFYVVLWHSEFEWLVLRIFLVFIISHSEYVFCNRSSIRNALIAFSVLLLKKVYSVCEWHLWLLNFQHFYCFIIVK